MSCVATKFGVGRGGLGTKNNHNGYDGDYICCRYNMLRYKHYNIYVIAMAPMATPSPLIITTCAYVCVWVHECILCSMLILLDK